MKVNKYRPNKLIAFIFCIVMTLMLCCVVSYAAENDCDHSAGSQWIITNQTCEKEGKKELTCLSCGYVLEKEIIPTHNYQVAYRVKIATCAETGMNVEYCSWCYTYRNVEVPKDSSNHNYGEWIIGRESTCTVKGERYKLCGRDGCTDYVYKEELPLSSDTHVAAEDAVWEPVIPSTCYDEGVESTACDLCGKTFDRAIPKHIDAKDGSLTGEAFSEKYVYNSTKPGTCITAGKINYNCTICGALVAVDTEKDENNHLYSDWEVIEEATCTEDGIRSRYCKYNRSHVQEETYRADHNFVEISFTPGADCETQGSKVLECTECGETETVATNPDHVFNDWIIITGSCANGGTATRDCKCGSVTEDKTFISGTHLNRDILKETKPKCTSNGELEIYCRICESFKTVVPEEYLAKGHALSNWITTTAPTCYESGSRKKDCLNCGLTLATEEIPPLTHSYIVLQTGIDATCDMPGISPHLLCSQCFYESKPAAVAPTGHNFVEQKHDGSTSVLICDKCYVYKAGEEGSTCKCLCHNSDGIAKFIFKIITFFCKIFKIYQSCDCGALHY